MSTNRLAPLTLEQASPTTRPILDGLEKALGMVPNIYATIAHSGAALAGILAFGDALGKGTLSSLQATLIHLYVSELNGCAYCVAAHSALAKRGGQLTDETLRQVRRGRGGGQAARP